MSASTEQSDAFRSFQNRACPYYPCHAAAREGDFSCLFCWCPLYTLGPRCGGNFRYTPEGVKDCSGCLLPHTQAGYDHVCSRFAELKALAADPRPNRD